jgi:large subunit ribosomal protein L22
MSAQKVRLVADLVRGKSALEAIDILSFTNKAAAHDMLKVLNSAIANAVHNENLDKKGLFVSRLLVDNATTYKRGKAVGRGRYHQIFKRNCHITVGLTDGVMVHNKTFENKPAETIVEAVKPTKKATVKAEAKVAPKAKKAVTKNLKDTKSSK